VNELIRSVLEQGSRNVVFKRHLPRRLGRVPIVVSPGAALSFWKPKLKSDLFDFASEFVGQGNVVWDIGANVGLFSIAAAHCAGPHGKVISVEADLWLASLLRRSISHQPNSSANIQVLPVAVANSVGIASFNIARRSRASNFLSVSAGSSQAGGIRETVNVITVTLDWLLEQGIPAPNVLKIDVEGAEAYVLNGAQRVLAEAKPVVLCEVFEGARDVVTEVLMKHGYALFDWEISPRVRTERACFNTLAIPSTA
jgi:FkbM family methyltransferase